MHFPSFIIFCLWLPLSACSSKSRHDVSPKMPVSKIDSVYEMVDTFPVWFNTDYLMGKFNPASHPDFMEIDIKYADRTGQYLRKDVMEAFILMYDAALKDGIRFQIKSATRNFENQKRIWENKWNGRTLIENGMDASKSLSDPEQRALKILEYSSMPGTSRHHWGTDIDLNAFENSWFEKGEGLKMYRWLQENANKFGFCQPYSEFSDKRPTGYFEEKWHWTYTPLSIKLTEFAKQNMKDSMIKGFDGAETAEKIGVVQKYVLGIYPACLN